MTGFHKWSVLYKDTQILTVLLVLFAVYPPPLEADLLIFFACLWRGRDKKQSSGVVSVNRFTLQHCPDQLWGPPSLLYWGLFPQE
jgi:hypothetical protein